MNLAVAFTGLLGLLAGAVIYWGAGALVQHLPILLSGAGAAIAFAVLLLISLAEMPMMLFGLRQMAHSQTMPRGLMMGTYVLFIMFAAIYASIFVLITGEFAWGMLLAALGLVRYAGGAVLK